MLMIACPHCPSMTSAKELDEDSGFAICRSCRTVFEIPAVHIREAREANPWLRPPRQLPPPPSYTVSGTDVNPKDYRGHATREFAIIWPTDDIRLPRWPTVLFASIMWPFTGYCAHAAFHDTGPESELVLGATVFCALFSLAIAYIMLLAFMSRTHLTIKNGTLQIRYIPRVPWCNEITIPTEDIDQLFCSRSIRIPREQITSFSLNARLRSREEIPLVPRMHGVKAPMFLQQRLREALDLPSETSVSAARLLDDIGRVEAERARRGVHRGENQD